MTVNDWLLKEDIGKEQYDIQLCLTLQMVIYTPDISKQRQHVDRLVQTRWNLIAHALGLRLICIKP